MTTLESLLKEFAWKESYVKTKDESVPALFFDWNDLLEKETKILNEAEGMDLKKQSEFLAKANIATMDFFDYFTTEETEDKVRDEEWFPIAALGIFGENDSLAEEDNQGFLAIVKNDKKYRPEQVIWCFEDKVEVVANSIAELKVTEEEDEDEE
jgi:hypothetical protein